MMRLIDADLLKKNCKITGDFNNNFHVVDLTTLGGVIDKQPTISPLQEVLDILETKKVEMTIDEYGCSYNVDDVNETILKIKEVMEMYEK